MIFIKANLTRFLSPYLSLSLSLSVSLDIFCCMYKTVWANHLIIALYGKVSKLGVEGIGLRGRVEMEKELNIVNVVNSMLQRVCYLLH